MKTTKKQHRGSSDARCIADLTEQTEPAFGRLDPPEGPWSRSRAFPSHKAIRWLSEQNRKIPSERGPHAVVVKVCIAPHPQTRSSCLFCVPEDYQFRPGECTLKCMCATLGYAYACTWKVSLLSARSTIFKLACHQFGRTLGKGIVVLLTCWYTNHLVGFCAFLPSLKSNPREKKERSSTYLCPPFQLRPLGFASNHRAPFRSLRGFTALGPPAAMAPAAARLFGLRANGESRDLKRLGQVTSAKLPQDGANMFF